MTELKIVATIIVKADCKDELIDAFHTIVDETRKEVGCVSYDLHQNVENPLKYTILEVWKSQQAIDAHNDSVHFKAFVAAIEGKVDGLTVDVLKQVY